MIHFSKSSRKVVFMYTVYKTTRLRNWRLDVCIFVLKEVICVINSSANWGCVPIDLPSFIFWDKIPAQFWWKDVVFHERMLCISYPVLCSPLTHILIANMTILPTRAENTCSIPSLWNWTPGRTLFFLQRFLFVILVWNR